MVSNSVTSNFFLSIEIWEFLILIVAVTSSESLKTALSITSSSTFVAAAFKKQLDKCVTSRYHTKQFYSAYGGNGVYYHDINYYSGITTSAMVDHYANDWRNTAWYKATH